MPRRVVCALALAALCGGATPLAAQARRAPARRAPAPAPVVPAKTETPEIVCPAPLGTGVKSKQAFCDVMTGRDPMDGILISLPPHRGAVTLRFDLHNRETYSEDQAGAAKIFARYTAVIGALTMDNTLVSRAAIQSEYRSAADLVDRIGGGAGPGGLKAVAPTGTEHVAITIPEREEKVSLLGEKLTVERADGTAPATYASPGRPIAVVSNVTIEYRPGPPAKPAKPAAPAKAARPPVKAVKPAPKR